MKTKDSKYINQGIEKLIDGVSPKDEKENYTLILLAEPLSPNDISGIRNGYEHLSSMISPYKGFQYSCAYNESFSKNVADNKSISHQVLSLIHIYNFAAKKVNDRVLATLSDLAKEAQLTEKFQELYNGEIINTGEHRRVLHHLVRGQLGEDVCVDGVNKRAFYVEQQNKIADFAKKVHAGETVSYTHLYAG